MIMINCCATCKYYNEDKSICMDRDNYNTSVTPDETCDDWKEGRKRMKDLLVRFCEYDYSADDAYEAAKFITGFKVEETYDRFANMVAGLVGHDVELKGSVYTVDDYRLNYGGEEDDAVCLNVYCAGC